MFTSQQFRANAAEYGKLVEGTDEPVSSREFQRLERNFTELANNEDWVANNFGKIVQPPNKTLGDNSALADEEEHILRCLGAAVIMQWNTIPTKLQRELFDNASSVGELLQANELKGQIARFLHQHKDDEMSPKP